MNYDTRKQRDLKILIMLATSNISEKSRDRVSSVRRTNPLRAIAICKSVLPKRYTDIYYVYLYICIHTYLCIHIRMHMCGSRKVSRLILNISMCHDAQVLFK